LANAQNPDSRAADEAGAPVSVRPSRTTPRRGLVQARAACCHIELRDAAKAEIAKASVAVCRRIDQQKGWQQPGTSGANHTENGSQASETEVVVRNVNTPKLTTETESAPVAVPVCEAARQLSRLPRRQDASGALDRPDQELLRDADQAGDWRVCVRVRRSACRVIWSRKPASLPQHRRRWRPLGLGACQRRGDRQECHAVV